MSLRVIGTGVALGALAMLAGGCAVFGIRTGEEAEYSVVEEDGPFEIREYGKNIVADTVVDGEREDSEDAAFFRLFDYIGGENTSRAKVAMTAPVLQQAASQKIDMTAPVLQERTEGAWRMTFVLPRKFTAETAPEPTNPEVTLRVVEGRRVAAVRFSGSRSEAALATRTEELREWMAARELRTRSEPTLASYDPPFTLPFLRRNEVLIELED